MESLNDVFVEVKKFCADRTVQASYNLFIEPLEVGQLDGDTITIIAPSKWLQDMVEGRFIPMLTEAFEKVLGFTLIVKIGLKESAKEIKEPINGGEYAFTFDTFIVGSSNRFAHAAALAVAQNPSNAYNPLFIHGESGLGKTHLLNAIRAEIQKNNPSANIVYFNGEDFTN